MKKVLNQKQQEAEPTLVPSKVIARELSCSTRYVHMLAEEGKIPCHRFGKACIRFNKKAVFSALGVSTVEVGA